MSMQAETYDQRIKRLTELELSAEGLRRFAALPSARRSSDDVVKALTWAAEQLDAQSRLIGQMRVDLQPFAVAAPSWRGPDDTVILDGEGHRIKLGHFRKARQSWATRVKA